MAGRWLEMALLQREREREGGDQFTLGTEKQQPHCMQKGVVAGGFRVVIRISFLPNTCI